MYAQYVCPVYICLDVDQWKSEDNLWEAVLSFHHAGLGTKLRLSNVVVQTLLAEPFRSSSFLSFDVCSDPYTFLFLLHSGSNFLSYGSFSLTHFLHMSSYTQLNSLVLIHVFI